MKWEAGEASSAACERGNEEFGDFDCGFFFFASEEQYCFSGVEYFCAFEYHLQ